MFSEQSFLFLCNNSSFDIFFLLFLAPAQTPAAVVELLNRVINDAAASEAIKGRLQREGAEPLRMTSAAFAKELTQELNAWQTIASSAHLR